MVKMTGEFVKLVVLFLLATTQESSADVSREATYLQNGDCWEITSVKYEENGYFTLKFIQSYFFSPSGCSVNVLYDVRTSPKGQIRGSKGVNGRRIKKNLV